MEPIAAEAKPIVKVMYRIVCRDVSVKDVYVGQTGNLKARKARHKTACNNVKDVGHNLYLYRFIRERGGFDNWDMVQIEAFTCTDKNEVAARERYWIEHLSATLNKIVPGRTDAEYYTANKPKIAQRAAEYRAANRPLFAQRSAEYYTANKPKIEQRMAAYRVENRDLINQRDAVYRAENRDCVNQRSADFYAANRDRINQRAREQRAEKRALSV